MSPKVVTIAERPDLYERFDEIADPWPEFIHHDDVVNRLWPRLYDAFPSYQLALVDEDGETLVGKGNSIPVRWHGGEELPGGVDHALERGLAADEEPNVSCALVAIVDANHRGRGFSTLLLEGMRDVARSARLEALVAPVRPIWKERYPLVPMERYMGWPRQDGLPFDPWMRVHHRLGAEVLGIARQSLDVQGTVSDWEEWTGMAFPETGEYVVPGALVPVRIDREENVGRYVEPNVWMRHPAR